MAIRFDGELNTLIRDLEHRGFRVEATRRIPGAPGRSADIFLKNGAIVRWDPYSARVWADGALPAVRKVEMYLRRLYEGGWWSRAWATRRLSYTKRPAIEAAGKALVLKSPAGT
jgi:hypothetical protein